MKRWYLPKVFITLAKFLLTALALNVILENFGRGLVQFKDCIIELEVAFLIS
jgi:hypothetical protein